MICLFFLFSFSFFFKKYFSFQLVFQSIFLDFLLDLFFLIFWIWFFFFFWSFSFWTVALIFCKFFLMITFWDSLELFGFCFERIATFRSSPVRSSPGLFNDKFTGSSRRKSRGPFPTPWVSPDWAVATTFQATLVVVRSCNMTVVGQDSPWVYHRFPQLKSPSCFLSFGQVPLGWLTKLRCLCESCEMLHWQNGLDVRGRGEVRL